MLLRLESLFHFSFSPPLAGGNIAILLGVILLDLDSCIMPVFQPLGILESWDLAVFFDSCGLSWLLRTSWISWFPGFFIVLWFFVLLVVFWTLVVFRTLCSLPDSLVSRHSGSYIFIENFYFFQKHINKHTCTCLWLENSFLKGQFHESRKGFI